MKKTSFVMIGLVMLLLLVAACDKEAESNNNNAGTGNNNENTAGNNENTGSQNEEETENNEGSNELKNIFSKQTNVQFMVKYDVEMISDGETIQSELTQYVKGTGNLRMDSEFEGIESRTYIDGLEYHVCSKPTGSWSCMKLEFKESDIDKTRKEIENNVDKYKITKLPPRTIAGASTSCYNIKHENGDVEYCYTAEGIPLYIKSTATMGGDTIVSTMTATQFSKTVADSVFVRPAESQDMGDLQDPENLAKLIEQYS